MRSILIKGRNFAPNTEINSGNRFNKTKNNTFKLVSPLSHKGKTFTRDNLHTFLSNFLVDDDAYEDYDTGIEDAIEVNES